MQRTFELTARERAAWRDINKTLARSEAMMKALIEAGKPNEAGALSDKVTGLKCRSAELQWRISNRIRSAVAKDGCDLGIPDRCLVSGGGHTAYLYWSASRTGC